MGYVSGNADVTGEPTLQKPPRLFDEVRRVLRLKQYSQRTEQAYLSGMRRFILANG